MEQGPKKITIVNTAIRLPDGAIFRKGLGPIEHDSLRQYNEQTKAGLGEI